jgi:hypothetical protein
MKCLTDISNSDNNDILTINLYAKTKLGNLFIYKLIYLKFS